MNRWEHHKSSKIYNSEYLNALLCDQRSMVNLEGRHFPEGIPPGNLASTCVVVIVIYGMFGSDSG